MSMFCHNVHLPLTTRLHKSFGFTTLPGYVPTQPRAYINQSLLLLHNAIKKNVLTKVPASIQECIFSCTRGMQHFFDMRSLIFVSLFVALTTGREEQMHPGQLDCISSLSRKCVVFFFFCLLKAGQVYSLMYRVNWHLDGELSHPCIWQTLIQTDSPMRGKYPKHCAPNGKVKNPLII